MAAHDLARPTRLLGAPDAFMPFGSQTDQLRAAGLLPEQIQATARALWEQVAGTTRRRKQRSA